VTLDGTGDSDHKLAECCEKLKALPEVVLPRDEEGCPIFDLCLVVVWETMVMLDHCAPIKMTF
jgi:hypothetical protein